MLPANSDGCSSSSEQQGQCRSRGQSCCDVDNEIEQPIAESETFMILGQFEKLYKNRLAEVEAGADLTNAQITELKLKIMTDWVDDLGEQNKMLVKTVHELEQAAISRVKLLETKLQETSTLMSHNMSHSDKSEEDLNALAKRTNILLRDQNNMQQNVDYLQSDVTNLLKLIKRGREENNWNLDGIKFYVIQPSDIPAPSDCSCCQLENIAEDRLHDNTTKQFEELRTLLILKDKEISKLNIILNEKSNQAVNRKDGNFLNKVSIENQNYTQSHSTNLVNLTNKDDILSLKMENEIILEQLKNVQNMHEMEIAITNEKLQDVKDSLCNYRSDVIEKNQYRDNIKEFIAVIENKIIYIQNLFQNKCEMCAKENLLSEIKEIISKVTSGISTLSKIYENKNKASLPIDNMNTKNDANYNKKHVTENEQKAIFASILQQFRMMEEFRICTVEVQAATEDLREEMSLVISNLNTRHTKYLELSKMVIQVQDHLTRTRENISEVINRLELQEEERVRRNERITNNRIRLKDIKNEFNQTQSELSKCLNNVHNSIQQTNLLGYAEIHTCNNLLITLVEEVEQIVSNLHNFQTQGCCTLSTMTELRKQLTVTEHNVKELKQKSDQVLIENEAAQKYFIERSKRLEKYECEVDNCHTKMQDVLESIIATRNQINKFGCIKETEDSFQTTNETIKLKDDLRRLHKECEELKLKIAQESLKDKQDQMESVWENKVIELQDKIKLLKTEIKCKEEANIFLKQSIESLENELDSVRTKAENYRKRTSIECLELKKKIIEFENCLRVQKDTENNLKCLVNDDADLKKSQLFNYANKDQIHDSTIHGLQGVHENMTQLLKALQSTIQTITTGLQEVGEELKRLVSEGSSHSCSSINSIRTAIEIFTKYTERIKYCSFEIEKIKTALCSKHKLIENMDEIIRIQKDSILISQSEVENLNKTLHDKIDVQEKAIFLCEQEKRQLNKQIELQVQTINHLQDAVVEAKRTIDQLNKKAASDVSEQWSSVSNHSTVHDV